MLVGAWVGIILALIGIGSLFFSVEDVKAIIQLPSTPLITTLTVIGLTGVLGIYFSAILWCLKKALLVSYSDFRFTIDSSFAARFPQHTFRRAFWRFWGGLFGISLVATLPITFLTLLLGGGKGWDNAFMYIFGIIVQWLVMQFLLARPTIFGFTLAAPSKDQESGIGETIKS